MLNEKVNCMNQSKKYLAIALLLISTSLSAQLKVDDIKSFTLSNGAKKYCNKILLRSAFNSKGRFDKEKYSSCVLFPTLWMETFMRLASVKEIMAFYIAAKIKTFLTRTSGINFPYAAKHLSP